MVQVASDIVVEVDWDNDGDFDQLVENITDYVMAAETKTGRDYPSQLTGKAGPGECKITLLNSDDRFGWHNSASPLNTDPFRILTGRKVRIRTTTAASPDPALITRDRFQRADGALLATETGLPWVTETPDSLVIEDGLAVATSPTTVEHIELVDVDTVDYYLQLTHGMLEGGCFAGIYYRYTDANNYGFVTRNSGGSVRHFSVVAGVSTDTDLGNFRHSTNETDNATIGVHVDGTDATVYLEGVPLGTVNAAPGADTRVGITALWIFTTTRRPAVRSFHVWDGLPTQVQGILWTGPLKDLVGSVTNTGPKTATLTGDGILAAVAAVDVTPEISIDGSPTGIAVGHVLNRAGVMEPPFPLTAGDITTGPWGIEQQNALDLARRFETTEFGFLYETNEGYLAYEGRTARDSSYALVTFSDSPGPGHLGYESIAPKDWRREVINRAQAGVAGGAPADTFDDVTFSDSNGTAAGVANDVLVTLPAVGRGDLLLVFIASTVGFNTNVPWLEPIWWVAMRTSAPGGRQRVYSHICGGDESGTDVLFYDDTTNSGGEWYARMYVIPKDQWYGSHEGIAMAQHVPGDDPPQLVVPWGLEPSIFFASHTSMVSIGGGSLPGGLIPFGYTNASAVFVNGATNNFDLHQAIAWKIDATTVEDPSTFDSGLAAGLIINECTVVAVRGFNGNPIPKTGVTTVERSDLQSQDDHGGAVRSHTGPNLFSNKAQARTYCDRVLGRYADDRPIFEIEFTATQSAEHRAQAIERRVGDRMHLIAANTTGLDVDADFHIESIAHKWTKGAKLWRVTWELSPAVDVLRADTTESELGATITAGSATIQINTVTGRPWISSFVYPNMFPLAVRIDDEVIRLLSNTVDPDDNSPQFYNVERGIDGTTAVGHTIGAAVSLAYPWELP